MTDIFLLFQIPKHQVYFQNINQSSQMITGAIRNNILIKVPGHSC